MPRYTDIDELIAEYDRVHIGAPGGARKLMEDAPIADVVPRNEVAKIFEEIERIISEPFTVGFDVLSPLNQALCEYNGDIKKELLYYVAQLKEEYTEGGEQK